MNSLFSIMTLGSLVLGLVAHADLVDGKKIEVTERHTWVGDPMVIKIPCGNQVMVYCSGHEKITIENKYPDGRITVSPSTSANAVCNAIPDGQGFSCPNALACDKQADSEIKPLEISAPLSVNTSNTKNNPYVAQGPAPAPCPGCLTTQAAKQ